MILLDWQGTHSSQFSQTHPLGPISSKEVLCSRFVRDGLPLRLCSVPFCSQRTCGTEPHNLIQSLRDPPACIGRATAIGWRVASPYLAAVVRELQICTVSLETLIDVEYTLILTLYDTSCAIEGAMADKESELRRM